MNIIDIIIIAIILVFGFIGLFHGFIREVVSTIGYFLSFLFSYHLSLPLAKLLMKAFPLYKFKGGLISLNILMYQLIAFFLLFILISLLVALLSYLAKGIEKFFKKTVILGVISKILGFIFGLLKGIIVAYIFILFISLPFFNKSYLYKSKLRPVMLDNTLVLSKIVGDMKDYYGEIEDILVKYKNSQESDDVNQKIIDVLVENNIISQKESNNLK